MKKNFYLFLSISFFIHSALFFIPYKKASALKNQVVKLRVLSGKKEFKYHKKNKGKINSKTQNFSNFAEEREVKTENFNKIDSNNNLYSENNIEIQEFDFENFNGPKIFNFKPSYPFILKKRGIEGEVNLKILIDENGRVEDIVILSSNDERFTKSVLDAIKKARFEPAFVSKKYIKSWGVLKVKFKLED